MKIWPFFADELATDDGRYNGWIDSTNGGEDRIHLTAHLKKTLADIEALQLRINDHLDGLATSPQHAGVVPPVKSTRRLLGSDPCVECEAAAPCYSPVCCTDGKMSTKGACADCAGAKSAGCDACHPCSACGSGLPPPGSTCPPTSPIWDSAVPAWGELTCCCCTLLALTMMSSSNDLLKRWLSVRMTSCRAVHSNMRGRK